MLQYIHHREAASTGNEDKHEVYINSSVASWRQAKRSYDATSGKLMCIPFLYYQTILLSTTETWEYILKSSLVQMHIRIELCRTLARPVLNYGSKAWTIRR